MLCRYSGDTNRTAPVARGWGNVLTATGAIRLALHEED